MIKKLGEERFKTLRIQHNIYKKRDRKLEVIKWKRAYCDLLQRKLKRNMSNKKDRQPCVNCKKLIETWVYENEKEKYLCLICWQKDGKQMPINYTITN